jgi:hypothetical protein
MNPMGLPGFRNFERRQLLHLVGKVLDALRGVGIANVAPRFSTALPLPVSINCGPCIAGSTPQQPWFRLAEETAGILGPV